MSGERKRQHSVRLSYKCGSKETQQEGEGRREKSRSISYLGRSNDATVSEDTAEHTGTGDTWPSFT